MMKKGFLVAITATALLFTGCEELANQCGISAEDLGFTEEYNKHLGAAIYVYQQSDRALRDSDLDVNGTAVIDGAMCTKTPDSLIIAFDGVTPGADNVIRSGSFRMGLIGDYLTPGGKATLLLDNYQTGDVRYTGEFSLDNTTPSGTANPRYDISVATFAVDTFNLSANMVADWVSGFTTPSTTDDDFNLTGGANLQNTSSLDAYNGNISAPILISTGCPYVFVSGELSLVPTNPDFPSVAIDFISDDNCENMFRSTIDCDGNNFSFDYPIK